MNECSHPHHDAEGWKRDGWEYLRCAHLGEAAIEEGNFMTINGYERLTFGHTVLGTERLQDPNKWFANGWEEAEAWLLSLPVEVPA